MKWYQEPWAIFTFAIPAATVIAGIVTIWIASQPVGPKVDNQTAEQLNRFGMVTEQRND